MFALVFYSCSLVFTRVQLCSTRVHSCSLVFYSCSLVFSCVLLVFSRVLSCSNSRVTIYHDHNKYLRMSPETFFSFLSLYTFAPTSHKQVSCCKTFFIFGNFILIFGHVFFCKKNGKKKLNTNFVFNLKETHMFHYSLSSRDTLFMAPFETIECKHVWQNWIEKVVQKNLKSWTCPTKELKNNSLVRL